MVACRRGPLFTSSSEPCRCGGGGGKGPAGGAGRIGNEKTCLPALWGLEAPTGRCSAGACCPYRGIELVAVTRDPNPECTDGPPERPDPSGPRVGDRDGTLQWEFVLVELGMWVNPLTARAPG
jgi:hypothetical protein